VTRVTVTAEALGALPIRTLAMLRVERVAVGSGAREMAARLRSAGEAKQTVILP
jgi:hypothetical protein